MAILFPLPYDGSAVHDASWNTGKAFEGKKVTIVTAKGETVVGKVHRAELSCTPDRRSHGVGFMLTCGSERYPYSVPVSCELQSITAHRELDYIRV